MYRDNVGADPPRRKGWLSRLLDRLMRRRAAAPWNVVESRLSEEAAGRERDEEREPAEPLEGAELSEEERERAQQSYKRRHRA